MAWTYQQIKDFVAVQTGEEVEREVEGPAVLGPYMVWRAWTFDGHEYNANYVVGEELLDKLSLYENFQPFTVWLMTAFNAKDVHMRRLDWLRMTVATIITLTLLALLVWAVLAGKATGVDYKWLAGALAVTALGYLLGGRILMPK
jgi:hypothetical protein